MTRIKLDFIHEFRKGKVTYRYFRKGLLRIRLRGQPGSAEFMAAYQAALEGEQPPIGASRNKPGSMGALAAAWYASAGFTGMSPSSQKTYRRIFEGLLKDYAAASVAGLRPEHIRAIIQQRSDKPAAARALLNVLKQVMQYAFDNAWRGDVPTKDVKPPK